MAYRFFATKKFWKQFYAASPQHKQLIRRAWVLFKINPFDPQLGTHKIPSLSTHYAKPIYSVVIDQDLRVLFSIEETEIITLVMGTHDVYKYR